MMSLNKQVVTMYLTILMLVITAVIALPVDPSSSSNDVINSNFPLGTRCTSSSQCANGAVCFALESEIVPHPTCGGPSAPCISANQCAGNTCLGGTCQGVWSSIPIPITPTTPLGTSCNSKSMCENASTCSQLMFFPEMLNPSCGGYGASCGGNTQCAFNTCVQGFCTGTKPSSTTSVTPTSTGTTPLGTTPLGSPCSSSGQCVNGATCFALHDQIIWHPVCGGYQSPCSANNQCASNACSEGSCTVANRATIPQLLETLGTGSVDILKREKPTHFKGLGK